MLLRPWIGMLLLFLITRHDSTDGDLVDAAASWCWSRSTSPPASSRTGTSAPTPGGPVVDACRCSAASEFDPVAEFTDFINHPYVTLPLGLDINKGVVYLWLSAAVAILVPLLIIRTGLKAKPDRSQTFIELVYDTAYTQIAKAGLPEEGMRIWFPYVGHLLHLHLGDERGRLHPAAVQRRERARSLGRRRCPSCRSTPPPPTCRWR